MSTAESAEKIGGGTVLYTMTDGSSIVLNGSAGVVADNNPGDQTSGKYSQIGSYVNTATGLNFAILLTCFADTRLFNFRNFF
jgi:hypothetical protein